jgi:arylsulfatase A-like enzyme
MRESAAEALRNAAAVQAFAIVAWIADVLGLHVSGARLVTPWWILPSLGTFCAAGWIAFALTRRARPSIALLTLAGGVLLWMYRFSHSRMSVRIGAAVALALFPLVILRLTPRVAIALAPLFVTGYQLAKGGMTWRGGLAAVVAALAVSAVGYVPVTRLREAFAVLTIPLAVVGVVMTIALNGRAFAEVSHDPAPRGRTVGASRNVVLVVIDTLRADRLGVYGYRIRPTSPFLDKVARSSDVYRNAYATTSWTVPSMATMFTGLPPEQHGVVSYGVPLPRQVPLLAERLRARGYATTAVVSNYLIDVPSGFNRGFDRFALLSRITAQTGAPSPMWTDLLMLFGHNTSKAGASSVVDETFRALAEAPKGRPLFLYVHFLDPHHPPDAPESNATRTWRPVPEEAALDETWSVAYDREVRYVDEQLERLVHRLDAALGHETLLVVVSDHGEQLGEEGKRGHGNNLDEPLIRVPLLVRTGGGGRQVAAPFSLTQLASVIQSEAVQPADAIRAHLIPPIDPDTTFRSITRDGWKLVTVDRRSTRREQLFRLPNEQHDRLTEQPQIAAALRAERDKVPLVTAPPLDDEAKAKLRALGYIH